MREFKLSVCSFLQTAVGADTNFAIEMVSLRSSCSFCPIFRFFNGERGAFTLFEATPESLTISQIDDNGKQVYGAKLKPRTNHRSLSDNENTILDEFFTSQT